jgi:hypothetical protein
MVISFLILFLFPFALLDRARYEGSVRLANLTALRDSMATTGPSRTLQNILEKQVRKPICLSPMYDYNCIASQDRILSGLAPNWEYSQLYSKTSATATVPKVDVAFQPTCPSAILWKYPRMSVVHSLATFHEQ